MKSNNRFDTDLYTGDLKPTYVTPTKLAKWLCCTTRHIYNMVDSGLITPRKFGAKKLFRISEVEELIESTAKSNKEN